MTRLNAESGTRAARFAGTTPLGSDNVDVAALDRYLRETIGGFSGPLEVQQFRGGQSNPTYFLTSPSGRYVVRRRPAAGVEQAAHAVDREYRVLKALETSDVPVPRALAFCQDLSVIGCQFYVMSFVEGRLFWDLSLPGLTLSERAAIYDAMNETLARLHMLDPVSLGLADYGKPAGYMARQVRRWTGQYRATCDQAIPAMEALAAWLPEHLPSDEAALIHGDYRLDNIIWHPSEPRILAVLDWELSTLGHPIADMIGQCIYWHFKSGTLAGLAGEDLASLGIPDEKSYIRAYLRRTGRAQIGDFRPFYAFAMFRLAAILFGVARRGEQGTATNDSARDFGFAALEVAELGAQFVHESGR